MSQRLHWITAYLSHTRTHFYAHVQLVETDAMLPMPCHAMRGDLSPQHLSLFLFYYVYVSICVSKYAYISISTALYLLNLASSSCTLECSSDQAHARKMDRSMQHPFRNFNQWPVATDAARYIGTRSVVVLQLPTYLYLSATLCPRVMLDRSTYRLCVQYTTYLLGLLSHHVGVLDLVGDG
ncbi:hypothetical protein F4825DRAFT_93255 [Nemania diffusa]|nr:hypothetical protein F4825DRAFT_93255 [Nemania diffusa]